MSSNAPSSSIGRSHSTSHHSDPLAANTAGLEQLKGQQETKVTKDGKAPKKRGPKPDTKPALTRRQELNRQAQRTHRERKEMYITALEDEVLRLKQVYTGSTQDKKRLVDENQKLKALLERHGIPPPEAGKGGGEQASVRDPRSWRDEAGGL